jgi:hypothetical protein
MRRIADEKIAGLFENDWLGFTVYGDLVWLCPGLPDYYE